MVRQMILNLSMWHNMEKIEENYQITCYANTYQFKNIKLVHFIFSFKIDNTKISLYINLLNHNNHN